MNARGAQGVDEAPDVLAADAATAACSEAFAGYRLPGQLRPAGAAADCPLLALHGARSNLQRLNGLLAPLQQLLDDRIKPALAELGAPMRVAR